MRRKFATIAVLGGLAVGLGCHHIAGKSDCGYYPADYPIPPITPAYPSYPLPGAATPKDKLEPMPIPKGKIGGND